MTTHPRRHRTPERDTPPAVVVGLDNITGLQTARILAARGVPCFGLVADRRHWGAHTNTCVDVVESRLSGEELLAALHRLRRTVGSRAVLVPCTDSGVETLSRDRERLPEGFILPLSPHSVVEQLLDKASFAQHAAAVGLPVPRTEVLTNRGDAEKAAGTLTFPCVVKPAVKTAAWMRHTGVKGVTTNGPEHLLSVYDTAAGWAPRLVAQEWVAGSTESLFTCNCYFDAHGHPLVTFVTRKLRQWPPDIGTGASGVECRNDKVLDTTLRVFGSLRFHGWGYLEMKQEDGNGRLLIIEPNVGRPTGRSATAEAGGVELAYSAYCDAVGLPLPTAREQHYVGAKWLDVRRDIQAAVVARRRNTLSLAEWSRSVRGPKAHAIWSHQDPAPFMVDLAQATGHGLRRLASRLTAATRERSATRSCGSVSVPNARAQSRADCIVGRGTS